MIRPSARRVRELERGIVAKRFEKHEGLPHHYTAYSSEYVGFHSRRFAYILAMLEAAGIGKESRILDVGPTFSAKLIHDHFGAHVDGLSFSPDEDTPFGRNYRFDLNLSQSPEKWRRDLGPYDAIVFAEVIEHLYTAPRLAMRYLRELLKPGGHMVIQTPNALGLKQRVQLLLGRHPYEPISEDPESPNHFRESTLAELERHAAGAGLEVLSAGHYNYFNAGFRQKSSLASRVPAWVGALYFRFQDFLPPKMRRGLMLVCRRPGEG